MCVCVFCDFGGLGVWGKDGKHNYVEGWGHGSTIMWSGGDMVVQLCGGVGTW